MNMVPGPMSVEWYETAHTPIYFMGERLVFDEPMQELTGEQIQAVTDYVVSLLDAKGLRR